MKYSEHLTTGSIGRELLRFALPILCTNAMQGVSGLVNAFWVGRYLGEAALTAVSNAQFVILLVSGGALGVALAATILVGQRIGANDVAAAKRVVSTSLTFFAVIAIVVCITGLAFSKRLLILMNTPVDSVALATVYLRIMFLTVPSMYMYTLAMSILRGAGEAKICFYFMLPSLVIGFVFSPLLMFGIWWIPGLSIAGSALSTLIGQLVSLIALTGHLRRRRYPLYLHKKELIVRIDWAVLSQLLRYGVPSGAQAIVFSMSGALMIVLVNRFGVNTAAAFGASLQLWSYIQMPAFAIGLAASTMAAQSIGAQNWDRVPVIARVSVIYSILSTALLVAFIYLVDASAYRLFLPEGSAALSIATRINKMVAWSFVLMGICSVLFGVVRASGAVMVPLLVQVVSLLVVRFPLAAMLIDKWQADAIWWSFPISAVIAVVLTGLYYRYGGWRRRVT